MLKLYNTLKNSYNLGNQYVVDCHKLIKSDSGFDLMYADISRNGQITPSNSTLTNEDFFKQLDPTNKAFRKYQTLQEGDIGLEAMIFGLGMRKNKEKFNFLMC